MCWQCWVRKSVKFLPVRPAVSRCEGLITLRKGPATHPGFSLETAGSGPDTDAKRQTISCSLPATPARTWRKPHDNIRATWWLQHNSLWPHLHSSVRRWCHQHIHPHLCPCGELTLGALRGSSFSVSSLHTHNPLFSKACHSSLRCFHMQHTAQHGAPDYFSHHRNKQADTVMKLSEESSGQEQTAKSWPGKEIRKSFLPFCLRGT